MGAWLLLVWDTHTHTQPRQCGSPTSLCDAPALPSDASISQKPPLPFHPHLALQVMLLWDLRREIKLSRRQWSRGRSISDISMKEQMFFVLMPVHSVKHFAAAYWYEKCCTNKLALQRLKYVASSVKTQKDCGCLDHITETNIKRCCLKQFDILILNQKWTKNENVYFDDSVHAITTALINERETS